MQVTSMLGTMLTTEELDEFMRDADVVRGVIMNIREFFYILNFN